MPRSAIKKPNVKWTQRQADPSVCVERATRVTELTATLSVSANNGKWLIMRSGLQLEVMHAAFILNGSVLITYY